MPAWAQLTFCGCGRGGRYHGSGHAFASILFRCKEQESCCCGSNYMDASTMDAHVKRRCCEQMGEGEDNPRIGNRIHSSIPC